MKLNPQLAAVISILFMSQAPLFIVGSGLPPNTLTFWRMFLHICFSLPFLILKKRICFLQLRKNLFNIAIAGIFLWLHFWSGLYGVTLTSIPHFVVILSLSPIFLMIFLKFKRKERFTPREFFLFLLSYLGIVSLFFDQLLIHDGYIKGNILAFVAAVTFALYSFKIAELKRKMSHLELFIYISFFVMFFSLLKMIFSNEPLSGYASAGWVNIFLLTLLCTTLGHSFYAFAVQEVSANLISSLLLLQPILGIISACLIYKQNASVFVVFGGLLTLLSVYLIQRIPAQRNKS